MVKRAQAPRGTTTPPQLEVREATYNATGMTERWATAPPERMTDADADRWRE